MECHGGCSDTLFHHFCVRAFPSFCQSSEILPPPPGQCCHGTTRGHFITSLLSCPNPFTSSLPDYFIRLSPLDFQFSLICQSQPRLIFSACLEADDAPSPAFFYSLFEILTPVDATDWLIDPGSLLISSDVLSADVTEAVYRYR